MSKSAVITARVGLDTLASLDTIATTQQRSRAWLVVKAIERYVDEETRFAAFLKQGEDSIARGDCLSQEEMEAWFASRHKAADAA